MSNLTIDKFDVIGISVRTTNENGQAFKDIPALWNKFMSEGFQEKIPNKVSDSIYCLYTDYEKDHTRPYTTVLGCRVKNLDTIPEGMVGRTFEKGTYSEQAVKGNILQGMIADAWVRIWNSDLQRRFSVDFEVYGEKAKNPEDAEVNIFISIK